MTYAFQYVPASGDLSGKAFEEQTERAINEIGDFAEQGRDAAQEAIAVADGASAMASDAVNTAQQANQTAQDAKAATDGLAGAVQDAADAASEARRRADAAGDLAGTANSAAATAVSTANNAQQKASAARETADNALSAAREARQTASAAQVAADMALTAADGGVYVTNTSPLDADAEFAASGHWHLTSSGIVNIPLAAPVYLDVKKDDYDMSVVQVARSASGVGPFASRSRAGRITIPLNGGTDNYAVAVGDAPAVTVAVTAANNAIALTCDAGSVFTPGIASPAKVSGMLSLALSGGADTAISINGTEVAAVTDGLLVFSSTVAVGTQSQIIIDAAESELFGTTLSLAVTLEWTDQGTPSVAWGEWGDSGSVFSDALDGARTASDGVGASEWALGQVNVKADTAQTTANTAKTAAEAAKTTASSAQTTANTAKTTADAAKTTANSAQTTANTAKTTADAAKTKADAAQATADAALKKANSSYELCEFYYFRHPTLKAGFLPAQGGLIANAATLYPEAWAYLQTAEGKKLCITEAAWQAMTKAVWHTNADGTQVGWNGIGGAPFYAPNTATGALRLPDLRGMYAEASGLDALGVGGVHGDAIRAIVGTASKNSTTHGLVGDSRLGTSAAQLTGPFTYGAQRPYANTGDGATGYSDLRFDISRVVPTANKVQGRAWGALPCVYLGVK